MGKTECIFSISKDVFTPLYLGLASSQHINLVRDKGIHSIETAIDTSLAVSSEEVFISKEVYRHSSYCSLIAQQ
jgi:hypothetical protein